MKILVYGINYFPEQTGIGKYTGEMCRWLAAQGHTVEVITAMPYYPEWRIHQKYRSRWWHTEIIDGVKVHRTPLYVPYKVTGVKRVLHEVSFAFNSSFFWLPRFFKKYELVLGVCPPLQAGVYPYLYKLLRGVPFVFHVQDLQVDMARELGILKSKLLFTLLDSTEKFLMRKATLVTTISKGMKVRIMEKGIPENKVALLPNWVDTNFIKPITNNTLKAEFGLRIDDKVILYSGSMGEKQGLEMILEVAERLKGMPSVYFIFCGAGASKERLQKIAKDKSLGNVLFKDVQPYEKLVELLNLADIHLVLQKKAASDLVFPSKLLSILSVGGLAIVTASAGSELNSLILQNEIGIVIEPEQTDSLYKAIVENIDKENSGIRARARQFAEKELSISNILRRFELTIEAFNRKLKV